MDEHRFDRLTRAFARTGTRRSLLAAAGGLIAAKFSPVGAAQLYPDTCAAAGEVCTLLFGCCEGLTCATSMINPSYGVCALGGDGGMVAVSTQLVVPSNGTSSTDTSTTTTTDTTTTTLPSSSTTTTTTTDQQAEREAHIAEVKARKQDRRDDQQLRKDEQQNRREDRLVDRRANRELRKGPKLRLQFSAPEFDGELEIVKVTNEDDTTAYLSTIEALPLGLDQPSINASLAPGRSFLLLSGPTNSRPADSDEFYWLQQYVCNDSEEDDGFLLRAGTSTGSENREYAILCNGSTPSGGGSAKRRRRRKARRQAARKKKN